MLYRNVFYTYPEKSRSRTSPRYILGYINTYEIHQDTCIVHVAYMRDTCGIHMRYMYLQRFKKPFLGFLWS